MTDPAASRLTTPDGRYVVVRGRLWRASNPRLPDDTRQALVAELMSARRAVRATLVDGGIDLATARRRVNHAKIALGERGPVWWKDGEPDLNPRMARNTSYADWLAKLEA